MFGNKKRMCVFIFVVLYLVSFLPEISLAEENEVLYPIRKQFERESLLVWKQGFMNKQGRVVIEPTFSKVNYFNDGVALVGEQGDWGYIDKNGKIIIKIQYRWATDFSEGLAQVLIMPEENGKKVMKTTFIDKKGNEAISKKFDFNSSYESLFKDGITCVAQDSKWGFIDKKGDFIINPVYEAARNFSEELAPVKKEGKWGFIDKTGKVIIKPIYDLMEYDAPRFSEGMARICIDNKWGFIDKNGKTVIEPAYEFAGNFQEGMAVVKTGGKVGYLDKNGEMKIAAGLISGEDFRNGLAFVMVSLNPDKYAYIDKEGKTIWESD